jgi:hypothetical protein
MAHVLVRKDRGRDYHTQFVVVLLFFVSKKKIILMKYYN